MPQVTEYARSRIRNMERDELLRVYGKLQQQIWPEELGKKPWHWEHVKPIRYIFNYEIMLPCRGKIISDYSEAITKELGAREIKRIQEDARFISGKEKYFLI